MRAENFLQGAISPFSEAAQVGEGRGEGGGNCLPVNLSTPTIPSVFIYLYINLLECKRRNYIETIHANSFKIIGFRLINHSCRMQMTSAQREG